MRIASEIDWNALLESIGATEATVAGYLYLTFNSWPDIDVVTSSGGLILRRALMEQCSNLPWEFGAKALLATIPPTLPVLIDGHMGTTLLRLPVGSSNVRAKSA
jgi:hypothetical protein